MRGWVVVDDSNDALGPVYVEVPGIAQTPDLDKAAFYRTLAEAREVARGYKAPWRVVPVWKEEKD